MLGWNPSRSSGGFRGKATYLLACPCSKPFSAPHSNFAIWLASLGFPGISTDKESICNSGDPSLIPGSGRSPRGGHDNLLQYSCLKNPHGQRSLAGYSPWGRKELDTTEGLTTALFGEHRNCAHTFGPHGDLGMEGKELTLLVIRLVIQLAKEPWDPCLNFFLLSRKGSGILLLGQAGWRCLLSIEK